MCAVLYVSDCLEKYSNYIFGCRCQQFILLTSLLQRALYILHCAATNWSGQPVCSKFSI